jgi:hypothetical protein
MFCGDALLIEGVQAVYLVFFVAGFEIRAGIEAVDRHDGLSLSRAEPAFRRTSETWSTYFGEVR